jgi:hypothetical protein
MELEIQSLAYKCIMVIHFSAWGSWESLGTLMTLEASSM